MTVNSSPTITIVDFEQSGYVALLQQHPDASCSDLLALFMEAMAAATAEGRTGAARVAPARQCVLAAPGAGG